MLDIFTDLLTICLPSSKQDIIINIICSWVSIYAGYWFLIRYVFWKYFHLLSRLSLHSVDFFFFLSLHGGFSTESSSLNISLQTCSQHGLADIILFIVCLSSSSFPLVYSLLPVTHHQILQLSVFEIYTSHSFSPRGISLDVFCFVCFIFSVCDTLIWWHSPGHFSFSWSFLSCFWLF